MFERTIYPVLFVSIQNQAFFNKFLAIIIFNCTQTKFEAISVSVCDVFMHNFY